MAEQKPPRQPQPESTSPAHQVLLLEGMEGVGRVTTRKVLSQFGAIERISDLPREQVLNRLKGIPNVANLLDRLADGEVMDAALTAVTKRISVWRGRNVHITTFLDPGWPESLDLLPNPHRPNALFVYGDPADLEIPTVAIVSPGTVSPEPFEAAQELLRMLGTKQIRVTLDAVTGFDVVGIKLSMGAQVPPRLAASCGLAAIPADLRSHASGVVKAGGTMVSSFPMDHGPFDHDKKEGSLVQAALAKVVVFVDPKPKSFQWPALEWALSDGMPVFSIGGSDLPERVHKIETSIDMEWVVAAVKHV